MRKHETVGSYMEWLVKQHQKHKCVEATVMDHAWALWIVELLEENKALKAKRQ